MADAKERIADAKAVAITTAAEVQAKGRKDAANEVAKSNEKIADKRYEVEMAKVKVEQQRADMDAASASMQTILSIASEIMKHAPNMDWQTAWEQAQKCTDMKHGSVTAQRDTVDRGTDEPAV